MISRLLLPGFASGAPRYVFLRARIPAHPGQADHVQRAVGLPVATTVETVPHHLARGGLGGSDPAEVGEGGLASQPLRGCRRPRSTAWRRCRCRCQSRRPTPGRPASPAHRSSARKPCRSAENSTRSSSSPCSSMTATALVALCGSTPIKTFVFMDLPPSSLLPSAPRGGHTDFEF